MNGRIKFALYKNGMSPIELSEKTGIPKSSISQYMSGYAKPKSDRLYLIAKALDVSEAWLLGLTDDMSREKEKEKTDLSAFFPFLDDDSNLKPVSHKETSGKKKVKKTSEIASLAGQVNLLELLNDENETLRKSKEIIDGALRKVFSDEQIQSFWYIMNQDVYAKAFINYYNESVKKKKFELEQKIKEMQEELKKLDS